MANLTNTPPDETRGWYSNSRFTAGAEVGIQSLLLAAEKLMEISESEAPSEDQLRNTLTGYVELTETANGIEESLDTVQMMLRVTGKHLMEKISDA